MLGKNIWWQWNQQNSKMRGAPRYNWATIIFVPNHTVTFSLLYVPPLNCELNCWSPWSYAVTHKHCSERLFGASLLCWKITSVLATSLQSHPLQHHIVPPSHSTGLWASYGSLSVPTHTLSSSWPKFLSCEAGRNTIILTGSLSACLNLFPCHA